MGGGQLAENKLAIRLMTARADTALIKEQGAMMWGDEEEWGGGEQGDLGDGRGDGQGYRDCGRGSERGGGGKGSRNKDEAEGGGAGGDSGMKQGCSSSVAAVWQRGGSMVVEWQSLPSVWLRRTAGSLLGWVAED